MITELTKDDFYRIRHITDKSKNIEVKAVVSGVNPGEVYVDHPTEATAALIWIQGQTGFHIVGDSHSEAFRTGLYSYMTTHIEPKLKKRDTNGVEISVDNDSWAETIQAIFNKKDLSSAIQHVFALRENTESSEWEGEKGTILKLDRDLLKSRKFENQIYLEQKIQRFWDSIDDFAQYGFGYLAEHNNKVVSTCFSAFVADRTHAIDIETIEGYTRQNYGSAVARAFVEDCKQQGIQPYWDCSPDNAGSNRLAESVGMVLSFNYQIFWYTIKS